MKRITCLIYGTILLVINKLLLSLAYKCPSNGLQGKEIHAVTKAQRTI